ncbi:Nitric oxide synthase oxygenase OS=Streptomyces microflavus OX=1919 GN=nos PE=3 SV=1 [Streptomyces microflavus]
MLPWVIETDQGKPELLDVPTSAVLEVHLTHPDRPDFADLNLRWHAVPAISNMRLRIGGNPLPPCAVQRHRGMGSEIGARNLVDVDRYNLLPTIAEHLGLDTSNEAALVA